MYQYLKKLVVVLSLLSMTILSLWYIHTYENQMFGGVQQAIALNKARIDVIEDLEVIAEEKKVLIGKQIFAPVGKEERLNTFLKIGQGHLQSGLIEQTDSDVIQNSPNNVVYLIMGDGLSPQQLVDRLNEKEGNEAVVFENDWRFTLLGNFLKPQLGICLLIILASYVALILSETISKLKYFGVTRLAGKSKKQLATEEVKGSAVFISATTFFLSVASVFYLSLNHLVFGQTILLVGLSIACWGLLLFCVNVLTAVIIYWSFKRQSISQAIKGKMPVKIIVTIVVVFQFFSILFSMFSLSGLLDINHQLSNLQHIENAWSNNKDYFGLTAIGANNPKAEDLRGFMNEVLDFPDTILVQNQFDSQTSETSEGYYPTEYVDENLLYVNNTYLKKENIKLSQEIQDTIDSLKLGQYILLVPESQKSNKEKIATAWEETIKTWNMGTEVSVPFHQITALYEDKMLFAFPVFGANRVSSKGFAQAPLMIIYGPETFGDSELFEVVYGPMIPQILVKNQEKVTALIKKYHLENNIGSLLNGYAAVGGRISEYQGVRLFLVASNILSLISSLLLIILLNKIYLYQNRKKFFIERLSGQTIFKIHQKYLLAVLAVAVIVMLIANFVFHLAQIALVIPSCFVLLVLLVFIYQIKKEKQNSLDIVKGE